jgi:3D (Asp-Asp-Asp) domain-containing protein
VRSLLSRGVVRPLGVAAGVTAVAVALGGIACRKADHVSNAPPQREQMAFAATAYSIEGETADGSRAREGIVAADPKVLPLGTRIRVEGAGAYDGEYVVRDTGRAVKGREIDLYLASDREATVFGRKNVQVEVVAWGDGRRVSP